MGKERNHLKLSLSGSGSGSSFIDAVGFGMGEMLEPLTGAMRADIVGELSVNEWKGMRKPQLMIRDLRVSDLRIYDYRGNKDAESIMMKQLEAAASGGRSAAVVSAAPHPNRSVGTELPEDGWTAQDLFLGSWPESCARLEETLRRSQGIETVSLLYPIDDAPEPWLDRARMGQLYAWIRKLSPLPAGQAGRRLADAAGCPPMRRR